MDDEKLIECVRKYSCIYDMTDPKYMDTNYKSSLWKTISKELQQSDDNCRKRWTNIRDQFKRYLRKRKIRSDQGGMLTKKYKYADTLQFLLSHSQDRDSLSNIEDDYQSENTNYPAVKDENRHDNGIMQLPLDYTQNVQHFMCSDESMEPTLSTPPPFSQPTDVVPPTSSLQTNSVSTSREICKCLQHHNPHTITKPTPQHQSESTQNTFMKYITEKNEESRSDIHPIEAFFQGLVPTVKRFSPYHQHLAKGRIFSIVQELEYAQLQPPGPTSELHLSTACESSASSTSTAVPPSPKEHVPKYHKWMEDQELREQTASERLTLEEEYAMQQTWLHDDNKCTFIVLDKETMMRTNNESESMIGDANLYLNIVSLDDGNEQLTGEIGLMVAEPQFRGRGLGKEIAVCIMRYGIECIKIQRFQAVISMSNEISIKMFEKLRFLKESESEIFKEVTLSRVVDDDFLQFVRQSIPFYQESLTEPNQ